MMGAFDIAAVLESQGKSVGPLNKWSAVREATISLLINQGLKPHHTVLDLGCGHLRVGSFLVPFLNPDKYLGIEPRKDVREAGVAAFLSLETVAEKRPRFAENTDFNLGIFGVALDFVVARSIWSHASREQIRKSLQSFNKWGKPEGKMLASFFTPTYRGRQWWPYYGKEWCYGGTGSRFNHACHTKGFIKAECRRLGMSVEFKQNPGIHQTWAIIKNEGAKYEH